MVANVGKYLMKLYENKYAPNPRRVRIFLAEKGINTSTIEFVQVDIVAGDNLGADFTDKNPMARIPTLELDDGSCIAESVAISRYFEEQKPEPALFGASASERVNIEMWNRRMDFNLLLPVSMAFRHLRGQFADREPVIQAWGEASYAEAERMFDFMNRHFADNEFVTGEHYSIADITALCAIDFARVVKLRIGDARPNLQRWHDDVAARPSAEA